MIDILLQAERSLSMGRLAEAERLFGLVATADGRDPIALVGLARVAAERGDDAEAIDRARRALAIDPDNTAARRLIERLGDLAAERTPPVEPSPPADRQPGSARRGLLARLRGRR